MGSNRINDRGAIEPLVRHLRDAQAMTTLIGNSPAFQDAIRGLPTIARSAATVLITGETGTGKELVGRAIHYLSDRASRPFVSVNCGSLAESLVEEDLFGHERGAFTDAHQHRPGLVAQADTGTFFLDEVDALSPKAQVSLLTVLQDKTYRAIGSTSERRVDIRLVAATNAPLEKLVRTGGFRSDLFYRLCVLCIKLPPLRERPEDILTLTRHFLGKHAIGGTTPPRLSAEGEQCLLNWEWPGNVRELENAIIRGIHLSESGLIEASHLGIQTLERREEHPTVPGEGNTISSFKKMKQVVIDAFEKKYLTSLMSQHCGNVSNAALFAGKERRDLGKLLKKHGVDPRRFYSPLS
ncbi:MAG TPA: sigma-54 dependent transcriptional regulator [Candidatus Acidoferrales bacterium]|jgi:DNA-binding NtrC family response regulator|nr:sigma-54 dependent transcriptional regulator [Candidatus Acidoferrales bacterium]